MYSEAWRASCQVPAGHECLVCNQQYLVLRYWNQRLQRRFEMRRAQRVKRR